MFLALLDLPEVTELNSESAWAEFADVDMKQCFAVTAPMDLDTITITD